MKVTGGESTGETGMVVRVEGPVCMVFLDSTNAEIRVFKRDLSESADVTGGLDTCAPRARALRTDRAADQAIGKNDRGADQGAGKNGRSAQHCPEP